MNTQKTIGNMEEIVGKGLHLGGIARVQLFPLPDDSGIKLFYKNSNVKIEPQRIDAKTNTSSVLVGKNSVQTIEHLMAALHGCGISNCQIAVTGSSELPFLDGSAQAWVELIQNAGIIDLKARENYIDYHECFEFSLGDSIYRYTPSNDFSIECVIHFPKSIIGYQHYLYYHSYTNFIEEIAPCRTFLKETAIGLPFEPQQVMQRLRGIDMATIYNKLIICDEHSYLTLLRAENEPVKHKILDFIGDIKNIGFAVKGKFYLYKPSHKGNIAFMNELLQRFIKTSMRGIA